MRLVLPIGVTTSCSSVPRSRSRTIAMLVMTMSVIESSRPTRPGTIYVELFSAGLYHGRMRTSMGARVTALARPASDAALIAAVDASGSAASTIICACACLPRFKSLAKSGGMMSAARTSPASIRSRISSRLRASPMISKLPVLRIASTSDRLSVDRDSSMMTVGR